MKTSKFASRIASQVKAKPLTKFKPETVYDEIYEEMIGAMPKVKAVTMPETETHTNNNTKKEETTMKTNENINEIKAEKHNTKANTLVLQVLMKAFEELQNHEERITSLEQLKETAANTIEKAAKEVLPQMPENDYDIVMSYCIERFRDWWNEADEYFRAMTGKGIRSAYMRVYAMLDNSGIDIVKVKMTQVREDYEKEKNSNNTLYKRIFNDSMLKGVFVSAIINEFEKLSGFKG